MQIDVLPLAAGQRNQDEVLVERVDAPLVIEQRPRPHPRAGPQPQPRRRRRSVILRQITDKRASPPRCAPAQDGTLGLELIAGRAVGVRITKVSLNSPAGQAGLEAGEEVVAVAGEDAGGPAGFEVLLPQARPAGAAYGARNLVKVIAAPRSSCAPGLEPVLVRPPADRRAAVVHLRGGVPAAARRGREVRVLQKGLPADRVQNNRASTHVVARGQRILLLENQAGQHK
ncbi:MAG: hypothetical protein U0797_06370 [Gemmataceae bacterium]